jgi:hypothetical protein
MTVITISRNELMRLRVLIDVGDGRLSVEDATGLIGVGRDRFTDCSMRFFAACGSRSLSISRLSRIASRMQCVGASASGRATLKHRNVLCALRGLIAKVSRLWQQLHHFRHRITEDIRTGRPLRVSRSPGYLQGRPRPAVRGLLK